MKRTTKYPKNKGPVTCSDKIRIACLGMCLLSTFLVMCGQSTGVDAGTDASLESGVNETSADSDAADSGAKDAAADQMMCLTSGKPCTDPMYCCSGVDPIS